MISSFISVFDSFPCTACQEALPVRESGLCQECYSSLPFIRGKRCPGCGGNLDGILNLCTKCLREEKREWSDAFALFRMEGTARELIHKLKYGRQTPAGRTIALEIAEHINSDFLRDIDIIVPVPLHWLRLFTRGFNQSEIIADYVGRKFNIPVKSILKRVRYTPKQANFNRKMRKRNLIDAFSLKKGVKCGKCTILLVDDVLTTGSTLSAAAEVLIEAGADKIKVLAAARA